MDLIENILFMVKKWVQFHRRLIICQDMEKTSESEQTAGGKDDISNTIPVREKPVIVLYMVKHTLKQKKN